MVLSEILLINSSHNIMVSSVLSVNKYGGGKKFKKKIIHKKQPCLALFLMDGCGHCKELKPKWKILKEKVKKDPSISLVVAEIKSDKSDEISNMIHTNIPGFPSIVAIKDGKTVEQFQGRREVDDIMEFVQKHFGMRGGKRKTRRRRKKSGKKRGGGWGNRKGPKQYWNKNDFPNGAVMRFKESHDRRWIGGQVVGIGEIGTHDKDLQQAQSDTKIKNGFVEIKHLK